MNPRLVEEPSGLRFYLDDHPIHAGDVIVLLLGRWKNEPLEVPVRFEWTARREAHVWLYTPNGSELRCTPDAFQHLHARWRQCPMER